MSIASVIAPFARVFAGLARLAAPRRALLAVLVAESMAWRRDVRGHGWIAAGLAASMVPGATYLTGWPQWPGFNHVDLAHGLILVSLWAIGYGARVAATTEATR